MEKQTRSKAISPIALSISLSLTHTHTDCKGAASCYEEVTVEDVILEWGCAALAQVERCSYAAALASAHASL